MGLNLAVLLEENAARFPERTALIYEDKTANYGELNTLANRMANVLRQLGVHPGQNVMLMLPNIPEFVVVYYGILKAGCVAVPINVLYKSREIEYLLEDSESVVFIACTEFLGEALDAFRPVDTCRHLVVVSFPQAAELTAAAGEGVYAYDDVMAAASPKHEMYMTNEGDTAVIVYTSGTTGRPKGAMLTHFNLFYQAKVLPALTDEPRSPVDVNMAVLPLFHSYGQSCVMNVSMGIGCGLSLVPRFDPGKVLELIPRHRVTHFAGVPTMYFHLLNHPDRERADLSLLRHCGSGGAPMPVEILEAWKRAYGFDIQEGYGLTETSPTATNSQGEVKPRYGSCGKPIWGCAIKVVDKEGRSLPTGQTGEVLIRGVDVMKGYYKNPEATAAVIKDGWFASGDLGKLDEDGYLYIVGRKKDMIIRGGFNVYPREIEELLYEHPAVHECAVLGVPHDEHGEEIMAVIALKPGATTTEDEIRNYCKERIAAFKYPRIVAIRTEPLPKGPSGKILKRELKDQYEAAFAASSR